MMRMVTDTALVLAVARTYLWVREQPAGSNAGAAVEHFLGRVGLTKGQPWCAAFFSTVGKDACGDDWRLPMTGGCATLGAAAERLRCLRAGAATGCGFLLHYPKLNRFAHVGFVVAEVRPGVWSTIEGNTGRQGEREGWGVFARERTFGPNDRFIHWWL